MTILLVNDIVLEADAMAQEIPWQEYQIDEVYTAYSANAARKVMGEHEVDILLCDIEMPDENGLSLIRWIQENGYDVDCVLLTCHADFAYAREGLSLGCQDYITLPAKYEDIGASVLKVCQRRQQRLQEKKLQSYGQNWLANQVEMMEKEDTEPHMSQEDIVERCLKYILDHLHDSELSVTDIASNIYLNPIYLNRVFKKVKGMNLSQWIIKERMELAATLLTTTDHPAVDIAYQVGYSNYPYFSTVFKKYYNCTPSQYVKDHTQEK